MTNTNLQRQQLRKQSQVVFPGFHSPSPAEEFRAIAAWCEANNVEHDVYGEGELLSGFEQKIATLLGKPAAVFMPSGVMAQLIAVQMWAEQSALPRFGLHPTSHLIGHEEQAYQALLKLHGVPVGNRLTPMLAADLDAIKQDLACLLVELPIRCAGGQLPSWEQLQALKDKARERDIALHMDGARLWESRAFYGKTYAEIADGFDSVYVSMYKGIGGIAGAVLLGDEKFIANARIWQRRMGGTLVHQSPMVASAAMHFDARLAQMDACLQRAQALAEGLQALPGIRVNPAIPQTNMMHIYFDAHHDKVMAARDKIAEEEKHWVVGTVQAAEVPGWSTTELYVGDNLLALSNAQVLPYFKRLIDDSRSINL
ncbi:threonine aldolase family protein [Glaciimonas soli]|uniref:Aminotransferase class I/II-fold pyridoxal phosphate-dependent enzyme n=1 Tax=Glaciimonas soli TaxID=2590999 RepID=A0A843YSA8_9BURK|nr:beta-eliminating lyase-related protein [Glaciimonas soli]MQR00604.1 aminotransferase class I/II-fold pyridoxal phosphate-dependent enzyme [Glaciimonas soli]